MRENLMKKRVKFLLLPNNPPMLAKKYQIHKGEI